MLDLHTHTTASDGVLRPEALVERAASLGVSTLAITDHDTIAGLDEARAVAAARGMELIPGVEISANREACDAPGSLHVLGYFFDTGDPALNALLRDLSMGRRERNARIAEALTAHGMPVALEEVEARAEGNVGRPHFAQLMVERGWVATIDEAFDQWLGDGKPACIDRKTITAAAAARALHAAGGIAVLAHPLVFGRNPEQVEPLIRDAARAGLDGIEVHYASHTPGEIDMLRCFADRYGLLVTGGSDFHGLEPEESFTASERLLEPLKKRAAEMQKP